MECEPESTTCRVISRARRPSRQASRRPTLGQGEAQLANHGLDLDAIGLLDPASLAIALQAGSDSGVSGFSLAISGS